MLLARAASCAPTRLPPPPPRRPGPSPPFRPPPRAGFELGIKSMKPGGKRRIVVPPELGPPVGPATFFSAKQYEVFDVELRSVKTCRWGRAAGRGSPSRLCAKLGLRTPSAWLRPASACSRARCLLGLPVARGWRFLLQAVGQDAGQGCGSGMPEMRLAAGSGPASLHAALLTRLLRFPGRPHPQAPDGGHVLQRGLRIGNQTAGGRVDIEARVSARPFGRATTLLVD